jgi:murein DD-endopeptidase MepM/ murein hydrolase activator NlpD
LFIIIKKRYLIIFFVSILVSLILFIFHFFGKYFFSKAEEGYKKNIKYVEFNPTYEVLDAAMNEDMKSLKDEIHVDWIKILSLLAVKYGGNFKNYKEKDLKNVVEKIKKGETEENIVKNKKLYNYYKEAYTAVLGGFLGKYKLKKDNEFEEKYGLKVFSPIAKTFPFFHYTDFGASRSYGYSRPHLGHDLMCDVGTPVVAIESGTVEVMGWNQYGGWRVGIRSYDKIRYWYYAHLRKNRPFSSKLSENKNVKAGEVIGYAGRTGYSAKENVNNIDKSHLHLGLELIFDESQREKGNEIWVDLYAITKLLEKNKSVVKKNENKEFFENNKIEEIAN